MKVFKILFAVLLTLSILFSAVSCSFIFDFNMTTTTDNTADNSSPNEKSDVSLPSLPSEDHEWKIDENCDTLMAMLEDDNVDADAFMDLFEEVEKELYELSDYASIAYLQFSTDTSITENKDRYNAYTDLYADYVSQIIKLYKPIYQSNIKDIFYEGWSEEEIKKAIDSSDKMTDYYIELSKQSNRLTSEFDALDQDADDFLDKSKDLYAQIVETNNALAKEYGYDNYVNYAYSEVYERDYSAADAAESYRYMTEYILPLADHLLKKMQKYLGIAQVTADMETLSYTDITLSYMKNKLTPYYAELGEEYSNALLDFDKNCIISDNENALPGAYTIHLNIQNSPRCYFGPGYQSLSTYLHEQGHYNAFLLSGTDISSLDLCEVHSQGNEWLYLAYSSDNYTKTQFKYLSYYYFYDQIFTIVLSTCCDAFEQYVYTHPELSAEDYDTIFKKKAEELGAYDMLCANLTIDPEDYWHYAIVSNSMYYYSYAVSLIPAVELFVVAREEGFDTAKSMYRALAIVTENARFIETVTSAGLNDPTTEAAYKHIYNYFMK